jgi:RNA polymerase-binding protein DksA
MEVGIAQQQSDVERLELARQEILEDVANLQTDLKNMAEPSADEADADAYEREKTWALVQSLQRKVESIDQAIRLAQKGVYGVCQSCGERIDPARLEILPEATLCLPCKREFERKNRRYR